MRLIGKLKNKHKLLKVKAVMFCVLRICFCLAIVVCKHEKIKFVYSQDNLVD